MRKYARLFSVITLILAITFIFSGCGVIDFAKSILLKPEETTAPPATDVVNDVIYDNNAATNSAIITPPSSTVATTPSTNTTSSGTTTTTSAASSTATTATTANNSTTANTPAAPSESVAPQTTAAPVETTKKPAPGTTNADTTAPATSVEPAPETTLPATTEAVIDKEEIEEMPLKEVQDMLFATTDPNTAGQILTACGFEYDEKQGIYYSSVESWQKNFGFNFIYDMAAPMAGMYYSTERILFDYDNKNWMIQLWKGQYGITAGAEIGVYNKTDKIMQYDCVSEDEFLEMSFDFYNQGEYVFSRGPEKHWWLTGFKIFNVGVPILINVDMTIKFPKNSMADAFEEGLKEAASDNILDPIKYTRKAKTFHIHW